MTFTANLVFNINDQLVLAPAPLHAPFPCKDFILWDFFVPSPALLDFCPLGYCPPVCFHVWILCARILSTSMLSARIPLENSLAEQIV